MAEKTKKRKSGGKIQGEQLRLIREHWFGGRCMWENGDGTQCQITVDLELAHAVPTELSISKISARSSWERLKDAIDYPERLLLFCPEHHREFDGRDSIMYWTTDYYSKVDL